MASCASRARRSRSGGFRCAASSSAAMKRTTGRSGARRKREDGRVLGPRLDAECRVRRSGRSESTWRRVGTSPRGASLATDTYAFADVPDATRILGTGKLTGRTASGYTVGLMNAVTGRANAHVESAAGARGKQVVEPLADY